MDIDRIDNMMKNAYKSDLVPPDIVNERIISKACEQNPCIAPRRLALTFAAICLLIVCFAASRTETAAYIYDSFISWCENVLNIDAGAVQSEYKQTRLLAGHEMTVTRVVFSEHEVFIAYTIDTTDIENGDILWFRLKDGYKLISDSGGTDNLFDDCITYTGQNSNMHLEGWNRAINSKYEGYLIWQGNGLNYENKVISLECSFYNSSEETIESCTFDIPLTSEYKYAEQTAPLDYEYEENGNTYRYRGIINTYSGLLVIGTGADVPTETECGIIDSDGNRLQCLLKAGYGYEDFALFYKRNSLRRAQDYTVVISDSDDLNAERYKAHIKFE